MPIGTIANGDTSSSARTKINAALALLDAETAVGRSVATAANAAAAQSALGLVAPVIDTAVGYVRKVGSDVTGNGSFNAPFLTIQKAFTEGFVLLDVGVGVFEPCYPPNAPVYIKGAGMPNAEGGSVTTLLSIEANEHPLVLSLENLKVGVIRTYYDSFDITIKGSGVMLDQVEVGVDGGNNAGSITINGDVTIGYVIAAGGEGGSGDAENPGGNGGNGGNVYLNRGVFVQNAVNVQGGGGGSDGGAGGGDDGGNGQVFAKFATLPTPTGANSMYFKGCIVNDTFVTN